MKNSKLLIFILSILFTTHTIGQKVDTFSVNTNQLLDDLELHMLKYKQPVVVETLEAFEDMVRLKALEKDEIIPFTNVLNDLLNKKLSTGKYFRPYIASFIHNRLIMDKTKLIVWVNIVKEIIKNTENSNNTKLLSFLKFSETFGAEKALKKNIGGVYWKYNGKDFQYKIENDLPRLYLENIDLVNFRNEDTVKIYKTSGYVEISENVWYGNKGTIDWKVVGIDSSIYCELSTYSIDFIKSNYEAKDVTFYYPEYFGSTGIKGSLYNRFEFGKNKAKNNPKFESYDKDLVIKKFADHVDFKGGFKLKGNKVYGYGTKKTPAEINISFDGKVKINAFSEQFTLKKDVNRLLSSAAAIELYLTEDKIYHPSTSLRYDINEQKIKLSRGTRGKNGNPFIDEYHKVDITVNDLTYFIEKDSIIFGEKILGISRANDIALFRSVNYFSEGIFDNFQNISDNNPIVMLKLFCEREGTNYINASDYSKLFNTKNTSKSLTSLLYDMVAKGFILYDSDIDSIQVFDKVKLYSDASRGNVDYDLLELESDAPKGSNGHLVISKNNITINDIKKFKFSIKKRVNAVPYDSKLILKKNRNIQFDGLLNAGTVKINGYNHQFEYDKFKIATDSVSFIDFYVQSGALNKKGKAIPTSIGSRLENTKASILIDAPNNKSGKEKIKIFPTLKTNEKSFVFYDKGIHHGSYKRDSFYFELDKFVLNNLKRLTPNDMNFKGELFSNNIFPIFKETITLQGDEQVLGFERSTPSEGFPLYIDKGTYNGKINLNIKGLTGQGDVNFLNAHFYSEDIQFLLDSLQANSQKFDIVERRSPTPEIPFAEGLDVYVNWLPYKDSMYVTSKEKPFRVLSGGDKTLEGMLILTSAGVKARGLFEWDEGQLSANLMSFDANKVYSDTASMKINAFEKDDFAFDTRNVNGVLDFDDMKGHFKANDELSNTILPYNKYITSMNEFDWDMKKALITFKSEENKLGTFTSIHKDQDSLIFKGEFALYDLKSNILKVDGVPFVRCADAFIYPEDNKLTVEPNAVISHLSNAIIKADTSSLYHVIKKAELDILGLKEYRGTGYYNYDIGSRTQEIFFDNIIGTRVGKGKRAEKNTETRGDGVVDDNTTFYMDVKTKYKGNIQLKSSFKTLLFDGYAQIDAVHLPMKEWFKISGRSDKNKPVINYSYPKNEEGYKLYTGFYLSKDFETVYPSVMAPLNYGLDRKLMDITGVMLYDNTKDEFIFGDSLTVINNDYYGNVLKFSNQMSTVKAYGNINMCEYVEDASILTSGSLMTNIPVDSIDYDSYKVTAKIVAAMDFYVPEPLLEIIKRDFNQNLFDAKNINPQSNLKLYKQSLANIFPDKKYKDEIVSKLDQNIIQIPSKINDYAILFGLIDMKWDSDLGAFVSKNKKNDLISIEGSPVNKIIESYIQFKMPYDNKDRFYVYIKSTNGNYYYFAYNDHLLRTVSNNVRYNDAVHNLKKKERRKKVKGGHIEIEVVNEGEAASFKEVAIEAMR